MITILVGDVTDYLAQQAIQLDPLARLITQENFKNLASGTYYTSLGDFENLHDFVQTLEQGHHLIYCPPLKWSDEKKLSSHMKLCTENYLLYFLNKKQISGQDKLCVKSQQKQVMLDLVDKRKTDNKQLWVAGCSISHGVGVDATQKYGQLLAEKLNLPVSFLTAGASSIQWSADQILRSDIKNGDTVVWGLTSFNRLPYYLNEHIQHVVARYYEQHPEFNQIVNIERLDDDNMAYQNLRHIHAVINFCSKIQAQLFVFGLLIDRSTLPWTADLPNYTQLDGYFGSTRFSDLGTDGQHPGPDMHQWYFDQMFKEIRK